MRLFTIGDPHLSFGCDKPMDIFKGWHGHVSRFEENWNKTVSAEDTVVVCGDISWAMTMKEAQPDFAFLDRLNGRKIILRGNHDYWFSTYAKTAAFFEENGFSTLSFLFNNAYRVGNAAVCGTRGWVSEHGEQADKKILSREAGRLRLSLDAAPADVKERIVFLHYPPAYYIYECAEILDVLKEYGIKRCYYGHIHGAGHRYAIDGEYQGIDMRLIACDYTDFTPVEVPGIQ